MDDEGLEPEEGGPLAAFAGEETTAIGEGRVSTCSPTGAELADVSSWTLMLGMFSSSSAPAPILPFALRKLPMGLAKPLLLPRIKQRRRSRSMGACDELAELDVDVSEGAEQGCGGVKHEWHGLLEALGAFGAGVRCGFGGWW